MRAISLSLFFLLPIDVRAQPCFEVFTQESKTPVQREPLPTCGAAVPELDAFDRAMQLFMAERSNTGGALAVSREGKVVLARGYGWRDPERKNLLGPETPFRLASVTKPITSAAIWKLILAGKLKLDDRVFGLLGMKPLPGQKMDPRWKDITIEHLLKHKGGWDRAVYDPMFRPLKIADELGKEAPASSRDVIQYMLGEPLQFDPGSKAVYSNFGYCVLGRVIEKIAGKNYIDYLRDNLLAPHGIKGIQLGRSLPKDRATKEVVYVDPFKGRNIFDRKGPFVPGPDGTFHLEAMDAHGGLIASSADVVRFLDHYWIDGKPREAGQKKSYSFFGSLPGTWTVAIQRPDGVNIVALFNRRKDPSGLPYDTIRTVLDKAADSIKAWPR